MDSLGMKYQYVESTRGHIWANWRAYLLQFAPMLFSNKRHEQMNHNIPQYDFYKHKYGDELLIDVVLTEHDQEVSQGTTRTYIDVLRYNIDH